MQHNETFETRCLSSLSKVFADAAPQEPACHGITALRGETVSFQVAYKSAHLRKQIRVRVESDLPETTLVRTVGLAPSDLPMYNPKEPDILRGHAGLYPDPLYPLDGEEVKGFAGQWRSVWVTVEIGEDAEPGLRKVKVRFESATDGLLREEMFEIEVLPVRLPEQKLIHTEWFHTDCLAVYYNVEVFSEDHWERIGQFIGTAVKHGINMILTPLFTPPLDTAVGGERPTVQLVQVVKDGGHYRFGFDRLTRWIDLCLDKGVQYFEFSHLFTQWGAKHAPKIVAEVDGETRRIFGWDTDAAGEEYQAFLRQFLEKLIAYIRERKLEDRVYFHMSDEPHSDHVESYGAASQAIAPLLEGFPVIDALSDIEFYRQGLVKKPIPANNKIEPFLQDQVPNLWVYYCCAQFHKVSNRFFCFPSSRTRIIGMQLYKFNIEGFLHWGYNFYFTRWSLKTVNPFQVTDAGGEFPSGDAFLVYPGEDGPIESIRLEVFYEALQDLRAMQKLESHIGREEVIRMMEEGLEEPITFDCYPKDPQWLLQTRGRMNRRLAQLAEQGESR